MLAQRHGPELIPRPFSSPETVLTLRAIGNFESLYLSRSSNRLTEAVGAAMSGGMRSPPGMAEGVTIARTVVNELDSARFDPLLVRAVAKNAATALDLFLGRIDTLVSCTRLIKDNLYHSRSL